MAQDPDILVDLTTAASAFEADVMVQALRAEGIPAETFTLAASTLQWEIAGRQPFRVMVRRADLERAHATLRNLKADSVDLDWDEVDTGAPEDVPESPESAKAVALLWWALWIGFGIVLILGLAVSVRGFGTGP